jgi:hypothetical protein
VGLLILAAGCAGTSRPDRSSERSSGEPVTAEGRIEAAGMTIWMYGSHVLVGSGGEPRYALKAAENAGIQLSRWEGLRVRLVGRPVEGYPVDGGPVYLQVTSVKAAPEGASQAEEAQ